MSDPVNVTWNNPIIHIAGFTKSTNDNTYASYWKNGSRTRLSGGTSEAHSVYIE